MNLERTKLAVRGMTCGGCVRQVNGAVRGLAGVVACEVVLPEGTVTVVHDSDRAPVAKIVETLAEAGYGSRPWRTS
jgi:copper chaperone CopZ